MSWSFLIKAGLVCFAFCLSVPLMAESSARDDKKAQENTMEAVITPLGTTGKSEDEKQVRERWQGLLEQSLPLATSQIARTATFYPFAAVLYHDGQINIITVDQQAGFVAPADALAELRSEVKNLARNGRLTSVIYFADARVTRKDTGLRQTGVRLKMDHVSGASMEGFLPYVRGDAGDLKLLTPEYRPSKNATYQ